MGRAASRAARAQGARRARPRPSFESVPRHGAGAPAQDLTVREVLPWHVVASKLALPDSGVGLAGLDAANDASDALLEEEAPVSGVRSDGGHGRAAPAAYEPPLTYKVYTLAELDRRDSETPLVASLDDADEGAATSAFPAGAWLAAGRSLLAEALAVARWVRLGAGRPRFADALRAPSVVVATDMKAAVRATAWKKVAAVVGGGFAVMALLLFAVLTVADLTDDMRATSAAEMARSPLPPEMRLRGAPASAPIELPDTPSDESDPAAPAEAPALAEDLEADLELPPSEAPARAAEAAKRRGTSKKHARAAEAEVFIP
jgi:hypothetical protein